LCGDDGLNIGRQAIRPQSAEKVDWNRRAGESPEVAQELSRPPIAHLLMHQKLADALLLGE
jgi:hypothetical protein